MRRTFADLHQRYSGYINARAQVTGHLWQGGYGSVVMDEDHLMNAVHYVTLNPVPARLVKRARDWKWSSGRAHLAGRDDAVVKVAPVLERAGDFSRFLRGPIDEDLDYAALRRAEPIGGKDWLMALEKQTGRVLAPGKRGRKSLQKGI